MKAVIYMQLPIVFQKVCRPSTASKAAEVFRMKMTTSQTCRKECNEHSHSLQIVVCAINAWCIISILKISSDMCISKVLSYCTRPTYMPLI